MAQNMKMGVIAEGVETEEHVKRLLAIGCQFGQGYFFSKPVSAEETEKVLASRMSLLTPLLAQDTYAEQSL
jgi:EAL domain-containing protein (putative c-di-GMP-specific phosphodiesterase class I)